MFRISLLLLTIFYSCIVFAQEIFVSGKIYDATSNEPLIGVNIKVNDSRGAVTDFNGDYKLLLESGSHKIMYSYIGYETQLISVEVNESVVKEYESCVLKSVIIPLCKSSRVKQDPIIN